MKKIIQLVCVLLISTCMGGCSNRDGMIDEPVENTSHTAENTVLNSGDVEVIETHASILGDITDPDEVYKNASHVAIIEVLSVDGCSNVDQGNGAYIYPYTDGKAVVRQAYKGDFQEGQEITFVRMGGTIGWEDYLNSLSENEREKTERLSGEDHPVYVKEIFSDDIEIESHKTYLAYMDDEDVSIEGAYAIIGWQGGLREITDGKVKNNFTGEYQEISDIIPQLQ